MKWMELYKHIVYRICKFIELMDADNWFYSINKFMMIH